mgnify:CR=1 FL=1
MFDIQSLRMKPNTQSIISETSDHISTYDDHKVRQAGHTIKQIQNKMKSRFRLCKLYCQRYEYTLNRYNTVDNWVVTMCNTFLYVCMFSFWLKRTM